MSDTTTLVPTGTWNVDPSHSRVGFAVKHLGIATVRGLFEEFEGSLEIGEDLASTKARGTAKSASINTHESNRDAHLRGPDFFDAENYPEITFESTSIEATGEDEWKVRREPHDSRRHERDRARRRDRRHRERPLGQRARRLGSGGSDLALRLRDEVQHRAWQRQRRRRRQGEDRASTSRPSSRRSDCGWQASRSSRGD